MGNERIQIRSSCRRCGDKRNCPESPVKLVKYVGVAEYPEFKTQNMGIVDQDKHQKRIRGRGTVILSHPALILRVSVENDIVKPAVRFTYLFALRINIADPCTKFRRTEIKDFSVSLYPCGTFRKPTIPPSISCLFPSSSE